MKTPVDELTSVLERLSDKVAELEVRLSALEHRSATTGHPSLHPGNATAVPPAPLESVSLPRPAGALAAVGRVFLGLAGAYLLRALAESGVLPQLAVVAVALAYAVAWLVWAAQARAANGFARSAAAVTAALILSPMLWELNLRFHLLPAWVTAVVLGGFAVLASALGWKRNLAAVVGLSTLAAAITCLVLLVATRDPAPFMLALLAIVVAAETAACRDRWLGLRSIAAVAADLGALALILVYASEGGAPPEYKPVAAALLMAMIAAGFVIYGASTAFRAVVLLRRISIFEIAQTTVAFLLAASGILRLSHLAGPALGAFCLLAAVFSYWAAFTRLAWLPQSRNYHVFATWAGALFLMGSFLLLPESLRALWLALAAVAAVLIGVRRPRMTISIHGAVFVATAALVSGLLEYAGKALAGDLPPAMPGWRIPATAAATVVCYAVAARSLPDKDPWNQRLLRLVLAAPAAFVVAALAVIPAALAVTLLTSMSPPHLAATHSLVACLAAMALALAGTRCKRIELVWLAYAFIAACTVKLLFEDLRSGSAGSIAASLFFYGMAWVLVPRLARKTAD
jgi:hypothetical protein